MTMKSSIFLYICASIFITFHISLAIDKDCLNNGGFLCPSGRCISPSWLCDGEQDCEDNADEQNCSDRTCRKGEFKCANSNKCIPQSWVCDSSIDCTDRSDEDPAVCISVDWVDICLPEFYLKRNSAAKTEFSFFTSTM
ncbi:putative Low-density lipoprotein receptor domain class A [Trichinella spiralis]|uniref:putative Low-density lipoprotein receptor domain class A n=1 Tax=Trichinella spiralis TaxID=6334 RepID=UPI0001EFECB0|nr:putative Low-density lipoprotein receptor domain class A [Trichinella spiralis]